MTTLFDAWFVGLGLAGFVSLAALLCYAAWWQARELFREERDA